MRLPIKLNDDYPCQGHDADGTYVTFNDLLTEGQRVGRLIGDNVFPPHGLVVRRSDGLWVEALDALGIKEEDDVSGYSHGEGT